MKKPFKKQRSKKRLFLTSLALIGGASLMASSVYAAYAITDNAEPFQIRVSVADTNKYLEAGYYLALSSDQYLINKDNKLSETEDGQHVITKTIENNTTFKIYNITSKIVNKIENYPSTSIEASPYLNDESGTNNRKFVLKGQNNELTLNSIISNDNTYTIYVNGDNKIWVEKEQYINGNYLYKENSHLLNQSDKLLAPTDSTDIGVLTKVITTSDLDSFYSISNYNPYNNEIWPQQLGTTFDFLEINENKFKFKTPGTYHFYLNSEWKVYIIKDLSIETSGLYVQEAGLSVYDLTSDNLITPQDIFVPEANKTYEAYYFDGVNAAKVPLNKKYPYFLENGNEGDTSFKFAQIQDYKLSLVDNNTKLSITSTASNTPSYYSNKVNGNYADLVKFNETSLTKTYHAGDVISFISYNPSTDEIVSTLTTSQTRPYYTLNNENNEVTFLKEIEVNVAINGSQFVISATNEEEDNIKNVAFFTYSNNSFAPISDYTVEYTTGGTFKAITDPTYEDADFEFVGWHEGIPTTSSLGTLHSSQELSNSNLPSTSTSYYAIFKCKREQVYWNDAFYWTNSDTTLDVQKISNITLGYKILGVDNGINEDYVTGSHQNEIDLLSENGIYTFAKSSTAGSDGKYDVELYRKIGFRVGDWGDYWDTKATEYYLIHAWNYDGVISDARIKKAKNDKGINYFYINAECEKMKFYRGPSETFTIDDKRNVSGDVSLINHAQYGDTSKTASYSKDNIVLDKNNNWWDNWLGGWQTVATIESWNK